MTGQDEREARIWRIEGTLREMVGNFPKGAQAREVWFKSAARVLDSTYLAPPAAEVKAEALRDVAEEALAEWCPHGDDHGDGSCECPLTDRLTVIVEAIATHLRENGGA